MAKYGGGARLERMAWFHIGVAAAVTVTAVTSQSPHPFAPPVAIATLSLSSAVGLVDVNRDGATDVIVPGFLVGTLLSTLDENGEALAATGPNAIANVPGSMSVVLAFAGGRLDGDELEDLVSVTSAGSVYFHRNLGSTRIDSASFAPAVLIDDFCAAYPSNPPFVAYVMCTARVVDVDGDGFNDVLLAGGPVDHWTAATCPGFVTVYKGDGTGAFTRICYTLTGSAIDVALADLDGNGATDHLVVLTETGSLGSFTAEILHLTLSNGVLAPSCAPYQLAGGRWTSLAVADVTGDANHDYIVAQTLATGGSTLALLYCFEGDGLGNPSNVSWWSFTLPQNTTSLGDFISSVRAGDWNRDGQTDIAVLRGFAQAPTTTAVAALHADSELLVAMGPQLSYAQFTSIPLPGFQNWSQTYNTQFALRPLCSEPEMLRTVDLGRDGSVDLMVSKLRSLTSSAPTMLVTLRNLTPPQPGDARFEKVGAPTGGVAAYPARIGFEGGRPAPGNSSFACTIQNVQGGSLVGLMWGQAAVAGLMNVYGFDVHVAAMVFSSAFIASGAGAGEGFSSFPLPIPANAALIGDLGYFQWSYWDHVADVIGGTQATGVWIGQ